MMFPKVLSIDHSMLESSCSSLALSFLAPHEGYLVRSANIAFSIALGVVFRVHIPCLTCSFDFGQVDDAKTFQSHWSV